MKLIVGKDIKIIEPTDFIKDFCVNNLILDNPEYAKKKRMGFFVGNIEKTISLYKENTTNGVTTFTLPFGAINEIWCFCRGATYESDFKAFSERHLLERINLYDYQKNVLETMLYAKKGVLVAGCGAGKTEIGLTLINRIGHKALWLTHTTSLLKQSLARAQEIFNGYVESDFGTITDGKIKIGNFITFATVQTLSHIDLRDYEYEWDTIVVDECHHLVGTPTTLTMFSYCVSNLCARHKYGLTATPKRLDGLTPSMFALLGEKVAEISDKEIASHKIKAISKVVDLNTINDPTIYNADYSINIANFYKFISLNAERNKKIANNIKLVSGEARHQLVLCKYKAQCLNVINECKNLGLKTMGYYGDKKTREDLAEYLDFEVIVATYSIASEGLDMPVLDALHFATPIKTSNVVKQCVGRIERASEGKSKAVAYIYNDNDIPYIKECTKRCKSIISKGYSEAYAIWK